MNIQLKSDPIPKLFLRYLLPALTGMIIKSLFIMGDAWFIGRGVGSEGLGAIALVVPAFAFFSALAMMIGIGGATMMSIEVGKGNKQMAQTLLSQSLLINLLATAFFVITALFYLDDAVRLIGASGQVASLTKEYLRVLLGFFLPFGLAWVLSSFVRNDANPNLAMYAMSAGAVINLILNYIFVMQLNWGMTGAALGTGLSQFAILSMLLGHFIKRKGNLALNLKGIGFRYIKPILSIGLPIFFIEMTSAITIVLFNYVLLKNYNESYLIAYGLTSSIGVFALFILIGITQAGQPIISFNYGCQEMNRVRRTVAISMLSAVGIGTVLLCIVALEHEAIASIYLGTNSDLINVASLALLYYFFAVPFMAYNLVVANLFQAIAKFFQASVISVARGFAFVVLGLFLLPKLMPLNGVWLSILFAEILTAVISYLMLLFYRKSKSD